MTTSFQLPTAVTFNGTGVNGWTNSSNILLVDGQFTTSTGSTCVLQVGNFNLSIPQDSDITNFTVKIKGYRGNFNTTLQLYAVDNTTGVELSYPMAPFQGFSGTNTLYTLPSSLFGTTWTVDQANNIQLKLIADGELHLDAIEISADYVAQVTPVPVPPSSGLVVVDEFVQSIRFQLANSITDTELFAFTKSFTLPDGTPIQFADFHGTEAFITMDQGVPGSEENIRLTAVDHNYQGTGLTRLSFGSINNRGLKFIYPYDHDINLCKPHDGTAEFVISNSAPFYDRFLRKNQINALVSAPITVYNQGAALVDPAHGLDFQGAGVSVVNDGVDSFKKIITIQGQGTSTPILVSTSSATSGASQVSSLAWNHTSTGTNRALLIEVSCESAQTVTGITYNGVALTQGVTVTNNAVKSEGWFLLSPSLGTHQIVVTLSGPSYISAGAQTFVSVSGFGASNTNTGNSISPTVTLVTTVDNSIVVDGLATAVLPIAYTAGAGQQLNWSITANPNAAQGGSSYEPAGATPDNITMSWAITQSTDWAICAVELVGITSPVSSGVLSVTDNGNAVVNVDNTDPVNPVIGFDQAQLEANLNASGALTVATDGVTITGDGTAGNPLVAVGGGGGGSGCGSSKLVQDMTPYSLLGTSVNNIYTEVIPAGTLSTNNSIRVSIIGATVQSAFSTSVIMRVKYGGTTVGEVSFSSGGGTFNNNISLQCLIAASGTTSTQESNTFATINNLATSTQTDNKSSSVDSTVNQNIEVEWEHSGANILFNAKGILIEKIAECGGGGGGGGTLTANSETYIRTGGGSSFSLNGAGRLIYFNGYMFAPSSGTGDGWFIDGDGSYQNVSLSLQSGAGLGSLMHFGMTKNEDETLLYVTRVYGVFSNNHYVLVDVFDVNLASTLTINSNRGTLGITFGNTLSFVVGNKLVIGFTEASPYVILTNGYATEYEISGSTLINPTATNIYLTLWGGGGSDTRFAYAFSRNNGKVYAQELDTGGGPYWNNPYECTYTAATLTTGAQSTSGFPGGFSIAASGSQEIGGFEINNSTLTKIGRFVSTVVEMTSPTNFINKFLYQVYDF